MDRLHAIVESSEPAIALTAPGVVARARRQVSAHLRYQPHTWLTPEDPAPNAAEDREHVPLSTALLGISKAGGAYLPLDPTYPAQRLAFILEDSGAAFLLTESTTPDALPQADLDLLLVDEEAESIARESNTT